MITIKEAEEILTKEYQTDNYRYLLKDILLPDFIFDEHQIKINSSLFKCVKQIGYSEKCDLSVFEVNLRDGCENKRVGITQSMFKILRNLRINNAVVSFVNSDLNNYRISLLTSKYEFKDNKIVKILSNPRRYSYTLGFGTKTKTPYKFLISKGMVLSLDDLIARFSVEVVNKEFYSEIATLYTELVGGTRNGKKYKNMLEFKHQLDRNKYQEFGVRLIGRIIFCWFLRQKISSAGLPLIPNDFFDIDKIDHCDSYYHEFLEPLFFELLNTKIAKRKKEFGNNFYNTIPYLNGGLFSPQSDDFYSKNSDKSLVQIPNEWFIKFYKVLNQYNFTVDENTSYDIDLSIDPEMLGRIFENLLAEINPETGENAKKNTGSFYTPRDVVDYMVDNSILHYLSLKTNIDSLKLKALISYSKDDDCFASFSESEKSIIVDSLYTITTLDPACGSGAFPIGMLQKIVYILEEVDPDAKLYFKRATKNVSPFIRKEIESKFNIGALNYIRKLGVIQNSIFGVDIQPIAVEISRLRCFLSLIIEDPVDDSKENRGINPLPNLDFKFIIANSLFKLTDENSYELMMQAQDEIDELKRIREEYFNSDSESRIELREEFRDVQQNMLVQNIKAYKGNASSKYYKLSSWKPFGNSLTPWFDAEWMFGINDGFDVVIGNPPYIGTGSRNTSERMDSADKQYYKKYYTHSAEYKINMYALFMEFAISTTKTTGVQSFIVPDSFLLGMYFSKIRKYILDECKISYIALLGPNVFSACVGNSVVYMFEKNKNNQDASMTFINVSNNNGYVDDTQKYSYSQNYAKKMHRNRFRIFFDGKTKSLVDKIEYKSRRLGEYFTGRTGVRSKVGQKNIISKEQKEKTYKKGLVSGSQVLPYRVNYEGDWINIKEELLNAGGWDEYIISHPKLLVRQTADTIIAAYDESGLYHLNNIHSFAPDNNEVHIKYLLGLLNSKLMKWYYETLACEKGRPMPQTDIETLECLPIKKDENSESQIIELIQSILGNPDGNNLNAIQKIDKLVYKIYGINDEEQKIIEGYFNKYAS